MCILEIIAEKMDETDRCHYEQHINHWAADVGLKPKTFLEFLEHYQNVPGMLLKRSGNVLRIEIPNLLKKKDNASERTRQRRERDATALTLTLPNTNKNIKEETIKKSSKRKSSPDSKSVIKYSESFESWWIHYPNKEGSKSKAFDEWKKNECEPLTETLVTAVEEQKNWDAWQNGFIPHAATWIHQRRWEAKQKEAVNRFTSDPKLNKTLLNAQEWLKKNE